MRLPETVHQALLADTARAMARKTPAVAAAAAEIRAQENAMLMRFMNDPPAPVPTFDQLAPDVPPMKLHISSTPRSGPNPFAEYLP